MSYTRNMKVICFKFYNNFIKNITVKSVAQKNGTFMKNVIDYFFRLFWISGLDDSLDPNRESV